MKNIVCVIMVMFFMGCVTLPAPQGQTSKVSYVGDYDSANLGEIVVSVPSGVNEKEYKNLHISFSALINPKGVSLKPSYSVGNIVRRFEPRLSSIIVKEILKNKQISINDLGPLKESLTEKAQSEFDQIFSRWSNSHNFNVEIVLTSIFFTDASVGRISKRNFRW